MINIPWILSELTRTLGLLAAPAEEQITYLKENRVHHDELVLGFDAVAPVAPSLHEVGVLSTTQLQAIEADHQQLDTMSGHGRDALWTDDGIGTNPKWEKVRVRARVALADMGAAE